MLRLNLFNSISATSTPTDESVQSILVKPVKLRVILVRHGETDWNNQNRLQGSTDVPLNNKGKLQAENVSTFLKNVPIHQAFSSSLLRAKDTASIILQHHNIALETRPALAEIYRGHWQGLTLDEIKIQYPEQFNLWRKNPHRLQNYSGETLQSASDRVWTEWYNILTQSQSQPKSRNVLIVAHEGVNRLLLCRLTGIHLSKFWEVPQHNTALNAIDYPWGIRGMSRVRIKNFVMQSM
ncbi:histidine phosphatase family protein [Pseudanabaena sp. FACHB-1277]|uniref:Histidine phosphatase family protein n=1 Tax=Pseudanabaena cinerea FACHB-1277 TaxID=2949581 RepID=A0A926UW34_9CYAN|nr:histidine phosphatase family protein [Pseudanabaena cinerea]MBD2151137.1 histidine phosphatase family protein [Pseudanabaena cinerea FACHB-1277]